MISVTVTSLTLLNKWLTAIENVKTLRLEILAGEVAPSTILQSASFLNLCNNLEALEIKGPFDDPSHGLLFLEPNLRKQQIRWPQFCVHLISNTRNLKSLECPAFLLPSCTPSKGLEVLIVDCRWVASDLSTVSNLPNLRILRASPQDCYNMHQKNLAKIDNLIFLEEIDLNLIAWEEGCAVLDRVDSVLRFNRSKFPRLKAADLPIAKKLNQFMFECDVFEHKFILFDCGVHGLRTVTFILKDSYSPKAALPESESWRDLLFESELLSPDNVMTPRIFAETMVQLALDGVSLVEIYSDMKRLGIVDKVSEELIDITMDKDIEEKLREPV
jgi:hypothetical protein